MRIIYLAILVIILFISSSSSLVSAISIQVPDTVLVRGENNKAKIAILGTIDSEPVNGIKVIFKYGSRAIDISSVQGNSDYIMRTEEPLILKDFSIIDSALIEVSDNNVQALTNDTICIMEIEGLAGPDSMTYLMPFKMYINGNERSDFTAKTGIIKVLGPQVIPVPTEGLGDNYPNPFAFDTRVFFSIRGTTRARFSLYSGAGELIQDSWDENHSAIFEYFSTNGSQLQIDRNYNFRTGEYVLRIIPVSWKFASGPYFIVMETDKGVYHKSLMHVK